MTGRPPKEQDPPSGGDSLAFAALGLFGLVVLSLVAALIRGCSRPAPRD
jgi:hypothetical protein